MVQLAKLSTAVAIASAMGGVLAHPGEVHTNEEIKREVAVRDVLASKAARSLGKCANSLKTRALYERAAERRAATAEKLRKARGLKQKRSYFSRRDLAALQQFETVNHNLTGSIDSQDPSVLFSGNTSCILTPENTIGPYYVSGELIREDVTEDEAGVPMHLEMQIIDINTCEPIPDLLIDIWNCNSTGVYSGVDATGQGGLNSTFLRGLQPTDEEGVAQFDTIFPGHYTGRATHTHTVVHVNSTLQCNGSYTGGTVSHIGQIFFDEEIRAAVEALAPYNTNTEAITSNDEDMWAPYEADNNYDPFPQYVYLGDDLSDGLLAWISIGIDPTINRDSNATAAAYLAADGGHSTGNSVGGGGDGAGGPPSGSFPSGGVPSGAVPSGVAPSGSAAAAASADPAAKRDGMSYFQRKAMAGSARMH